MDLKTAFGRWYDALHAGIEFNGHSQGTTKRLEDGFGNMMGIAALNAVDVQRYLGMIDKTTEELAEQIDFKIAYTISMIVNICKKSGATGKIDNNPAQGFIKGHIGMTVATDAGLVAYRSSHGLTQRNADVFHGVVGIDMKIAMGLDVEIDKAVAGYLIEHVLKKGHPGYKRTAAGTIKVNGYPDSGFGGFAFYDGGSLLHGHSDNEFFFSWIITDCWKRKRTRARIL
jgi:hypothetical protein